jgi:hypothetical protein
MGPILASALPEVIMRLLLSAGILLMGVLAAQNPSSSASYSGQSWVGLLVSGSCDASHARKQSRAEGEANLTTADRVTTPGVDASGTRGQTAAQSGTTEAPHNAVPKTGDIHDALPVSDPEWKTALNQAASLRATCAVDPTSDGFSLLLPDGRILRFDALANQAISKQLKHSYGGRKSIFRVQVSGKLQHGEIALDTIQI